MADTDVLALAEAKTALKIGSGDTSNDTILASYITSVTSVLDGMCGPIVRRAVTDKVIDKIPSGTGELFLDPWPIYSVASLTEYDSAGAATALTAEDFDTKPTAGYYLEPYGPGSTTSSGRVYRTASGGATHFGRALKWTGVAGRYENTAAVAPLFKTAARELLRALWVTVDPQSVFVETDGFDYPLRRTPAMQRVMDEVVIPMLSEAGEYHRVPVLA